MLIRRRHVRIEIEQKTVRIVAASITSGAEADPSSATAKPANAVDVAQPDSLASPSPLALPLPEGV